MRLLFLLICVMLAAPLRAQDALRVGVFGVVEGLDPLVVPGREISVPDDVRTISPLGPGQAIALGDTLAVVVSVEGGRLVAVRMLEFFPVVGPVADVREGTATIMGTTVHLPPKTSLKSGQWVALSGLWSGEQVITTKVRRVDWDGFGQLAGSVELATADQPLLIGRSTVFGADPPKDGFGDGIWMLSGQPEAEGLRVRLMSKGVFGSKVDLVLWQGHASLPVASQTYMIHGTGIIGTATDALMPSAGALITRCAWQGRVVRASPEGLEAAFEALDCVRHIPAD